MPAAASAPARAAAAPAASSWHQRWPPMASSGRFAEGLRLVLQHRRQGPRRRLTPLRLPGRRLLPFRLHTFNLHPGSLRRDRWPARADRRQAPAKRQTARSRRSPARSRSPRSRARRGHSARPAGSRRRRRAAARTIGKDVAHDQRRQPEARLVEHQQARRGHQRPAQRQHLPLAARERVGTLRAAFGQARESARTPTAAAA